MHMKLNIRKYKEVSNNKLLMKRIIQLTAIFVVLAAGIARAQTGMHISNVLGGKYVSDPSVTEVMMSGDQSFLRACGLTTLATFRGASETYAPILQPLVLADGAKAVGRNVRYKEGKLQYAFFMLPPATVNDKRVNRYLYYLNNPEGKKPSVIMIYFDGKISRSEAEDLISSLSK